MGKMIDADKLMETIDARGTKSISISVLQRLVDEAEEVKAEGTVRDVCDVCVWFDGSKCHYYGTTPAEPKESRCVQYTKRASK